MSRQTARPTWKELAPGAAITEPGSAKYNRTGDWRSQRPVWNKEHCIKCGVCWTFCPEGCIEQDEEGYFEANYEFCKGCGICARECWTGCIKLVEEEE